MLARRLNVIAGHFHCPPGEIHPTAASHSRDLRRGTLSSRKSVSIARRLHFVPRPSLKADQGSPKSRVPFNEVIQPDYPWLLVCFMRSSAQKLPVAALMRDEKHWPCRVEDVAADVCRCSFFRHCHCCSFFCLSSTAPEFDYPSHGCSRDMTVPDDPASSTLLDRGITVIRFIRLSMKPSSGSLTNDGRASSRYFCSLARARSPIGTTRSFFPCPDG